MCHCLALPPVLSPCVFVWVGPRPDLLPDPVLIAAAHLQHRLAVSGRQVNNVQWGRWLTVHGGWTTVKRVIYPVVHDILFEGEESSSSKWSLSGSSVCFNQPFSAASLNQSHCCQRQNFKNVPLSVAVSCPFSSDPLRSPDGNLFRTSGTMLSLSTAKLYISKSISYKWSLQYPENIKFNFACLNGCILVS